MYHQLVLVIRQHNGDDTPQDDTPQDDTPQDDAPQDDTPQDIQVCFQLFFQKEKNKGDIKKK